MKKHYFWLWFDADGTLFDYNKAEITALKHTFRSLNLSFEDHYLEVYRNINHKLWRALEKQEITPAVLRLRRFELLLEALQVAGSPEQMGNIYLKQLAISSQLIDDAYEVLQSLHDTHRFAIVTNGLRTVQRSRLVRSPIQEFIDEVIISEEVGSAKPHAAFFDAAFSKTGHPSKSEVLIIGDSLTSDIQGGLNYGIDTCWYNPNAEPQPEHLAIKYEIRHLRELLEIVD